MYATPAPGRGTVFMFLYICIKPPTHIFIESCPFSAYFYRIMPFSAYFYRIVPLFRANFENCFSHFVSTTFEAPFNIWKEKQNLSNWEKRLKWLFLLRGRHSTSHPFKWVRSGVLGLACKSQRTRTACPPVYVRRILCYKSNLGETKDSILPQRLQRHFLAWIQLKINVHFYVTKTFNQRHTLLAVLSIKNKQYIRR
jgi:hypothetical protein